MRRKRRIAFSVLFAFLVIAAICCTIPRPVRVIGVLPAEDLGEIRRLVWQKVRKTELPTFEWDDIHSPNYPRYFFGGIKRYADLRILWIEVKESNDVEVVVGLGTNEVLADWLGVHHAKV